MRSQPPEQKVTPMYIDIHVLQSVPPSNLNRDDTGSPKSAVFGGVRRARVSSQAWKKAARADFSRLLDKSDLGVRTKRVVELIADREAELQPGIDPQQAVIEAAEVLKAAGLDIKVLKAKKVKEGEDPAPDADGSSYLVFLSQHQITRLAELALAEGKPNRAEARAAFDQDHGIEVSLFGRMVADDASLNVDAGVQVAHAISTHAVVEESDYYTAVDELNKEDESGAGMIGTIEFNSSTLYRYATINVPLLQENLGDADATARAVRAFVRAFVLSMPTGKQNTFANRTLPAAVVVAVRADQPVNLVGAFESPVFAGRGDGLVKKSCEQLVGQAKAIAAMVQPAEATYTVVTSTKAEAISALAEPTTLDAVVEKLGADVLARSAAGS
ncbi:type I-E CRISPR-associated protein Cas7/Cse4/CasC [Dermacoccaceae bacterium W4C1]